MTKKCELSIVTISMNHGRFLKGLCESLEKEHDSVDFEMVMIDNCSLDDTRSIIQNEFPWVNLVVNNETRSFSYNNNYGFSLSSGRYVLFLNPDIVVLNGALKALVEFMDRNPDVGVCGPRLLNPDMSHQPSFRKYSTPKILLMRGLRLDSLFPNSRCLKDYFMDDVNGDNSLDVDWLTGSAILFRRDALNQVGGFDERYPLYFEDQDLCRRTWEKKWRVTFVPQAEMIHYYARDSAKNPFSKKARMHYISMLYYLYKYYFSHRRIEPKISIFP